MRTTLLIGLAIVLLVLGVFGLFLPFLQGFLFIFAGLFILCMVSPAFKARFDAALSPYPKAKAKVDKAFSKMHGWFHKPKGR